MPGGEQDRQAQDRVERQPGAGGAGGQEQQRDLGRGVEPEPEQEPERVHLPRPASRPRDPAEEAVHERRARPAAARARPRRTGPRASRRNTRTMPDQDRRRLSDAMSNRNAPDTPVPTSPVTWCSVEPSSRTAPPSAAHTDREQHASTNTIVECPSEKKKPDAHRPLAFGHQLARRVVDRGDVVGVERVPQPERVGRQPEPDGEHARAAERVAVRAPPGRAAGRSRARAARARPRHGATGATVHSSERQRAGAEGAGSRHDSPDLLAFAVALGPARSEMALLHERAEHVHDRAAARAAR